MPIFGRGENIGSAYVRIFGDGSSMPSDIRDSLDNADGVVHEKGQEHGKQYMDGFSKEMEDSNTLDKSWDDIVNRGEGRMRARGEKASSFYMEGLEKKLKQSLGDDKLGQTIADNIRNQLLRGVQFGDVQKVIEQRYRELINGEITTNDDWDSSLKRVGASLSLNSDHVEVLGRKLTDSNRHADGSTRTFGRLRDVLGGVDDKFDSLGEKVGGMFGKGSRNNFLNVIGSTIGNVVGLVGKIPEGIEAALGWVDKIRNAFTQAGGGLSGFGASISSALPLLGSLALGAVALGAAFALLIIVLGPLIALLSGLLAILIALASTVIMAVVAGVAALAGALLPLAAGFAVVLSAFTGMTDKMKAEVKKTFAPLISAFHDLQHAVQDELFSGSEQTVGHFATILHGLIPIATDVAHAMRDVFAGWADRLDSPGFDSFIKKMDTFLPHAIRQLGRIFANTFSGIGGIILGMIPLVNSFLKWLEKITGEFAKWANSANGQDQIRGFLSRAADSAKSLGGFLEQAFGLLTDLINHGKTAGDGMFDGMTRGLKTFRDYLSKPITPATPGIGGRKDPTGDLPKPSVGLTRLDQWFQFATNLANELGQAATNAGELMATLANKDAQNNLLNIISALSTMIDLLDQATTLMDLIFNPAGALNNSWVQKFGGQIHDFVTKWVNFDWGKLLPDFSKFHGFQLGQLIKVPNLTGIVAHFAGLGGRIKSKIGTVDVSGIIHGAATAAGRLLGNFLGMAGKLLGKIGPVNVSGIITGAASAVTHLLGAFAGMAGKILDKISPVNVSGIISGAADAANRLVDAFRGLASRIVAAIGTIVPHIEIHMPKIPGLGASGGLFSKPTNMIIGEAGTEALVPLNRPLDQVDPAVRWLSAIAQGITPPPGPTAGALGGGKSITVGELHVHTPATDPRAVAVATVDQMAMAGYA